MLFLYTLKGIGHKIVHLTLSLITTGGIDDIFVLFTSPEHLEVFRNGRYTNMLFTIENEKQSRMSFLDVQIIREDKTLATSVYRLYTFYILTVSYYLPISLVLFTHSLIDASEYAQVGLNYTLN